MLLLCQSGTAWVFSNNPKNVAYFSVGKERVNKGREGGEQPALRWRDVGSHYFGMEHDAP